MDSSKRWGGVHRLARPALLHLIPVLLHLIDVVELHRAAPELGEHCAANLRPQAQTDVGLVKRRGQRHLGQLAFGTEHQACLLYTSLFIRRAFSRRIAFRITSSSKSRLRLSTRFWPNSTKLKSSGSVSYTHLDVYKRQTRSMAIEKIVSEPSGSIRMRNHCL